jgi:hypothetical protein
MSLTFTRASFSSTPAGGRKYLPVESVASVIFSYSLFV